MTRFNRIGLVIVLGSFFLTGCGQEKEDLAEHVAKVQSQKMAGIQGLPTIKAYEKFLYSAAELRNPFIKTVVNLPAVIEDEKEVFDNGIHPDKTRLKEILETYELSSLQLVGTLQQEYMWALVRAPEGVIHRVKIGDYMGLNEGQILAVSDTEITLKEIVSDGESGYIERDNSLSIININ
ncbi:MAG: pilus assembly protein PilP [Gammaproteobacteria bacterium]|nr:MAG: pilus assembly protein PilP [Gammaproteobacteria bacterium]